MGAAVWLYVPALVFGHMFSLLWLLSALLLNTKRRLAPTPASKANVQPDGVHSSHPGSNRTPLTLTFFQLSCSFQDAARQTVTALCGATGSALPGEMLAVLGASGAGKSTLMDVLALRQVSGKVSGSILVNGALVTMDFVKRLAYVPQEDAFPPVLTAHEVVNFHAALCSHVRQCTSMNQRIAATQRAEAALNAMGLTQQRNTLVGGVLSTGIRFSGLSGGQKRRLNIAAHLVGDPSVLFLDEPTSGLDASSALKVLSHLHVVAKSGRTVMLTIHQPRAAIWQLLDQVMVMAYGHVLFQGSPDTVVPWFTQRLGCSYDPAHHGITSDWLMDLLSPVDNKAGADAGDVEVCCPAMGGQLSQPRAVAAAAELFTQHFIQQQKQKQCTSHVVGQDAIPSSGAAANQSVAARSDRSSGCWSNGVRVWLSLLRTLLDREGLLVVRNPADAAGRMLACMYCALLIGLVYLNVATGSGDDAAARTGCIFAVIMCVAEVPFASMSLFMAEKALVLHEASQELYPTSAYYVARTLVATTFAVLNAGVVALVVYGLAGFRLEPASAVGWNVLFMVLVHLVFVQMLHASATVAPSQDTAFMISIVFLTFSVMLANFLVRWQDMQWAAPIALRFTSPLYYGFGAMIRAEFSDSAASCTSLKPADPAGQAACVAYNDGVSAYYTNYAYGVSAAALCGMLVGLHAFSYASLVWQVRRQRASHHNV